MTLVELIPATSEAILCGVMAGDQLVLVHSKEKAATRSVDLMVRSKSVQVTDRVVEAIGKM